MDYFLSLKMSDVYMFTKSDAGLEKYMSPFTPSRFTYPIILGHVLEFALKSKMENIME